LAASSPLTDSLSRHLRYSLGRNHGDHSSHALFTALALALREPLIDGLLDSERRYTAAGSKRLSYLSMEFLLGRSLENNLLNLGLWEDCSRALAKQGYTLDDLRHSERDAALGNGGLGRLAACFLDSLATLDLPGSGYGINYEFGLFRQEIRDGYQREKPDNWLVNGNPWAIPRPEEACHVPVYGRVVHDNDRQGRYNPMWLDWQLLIGVPYDMPIVGYGGRTVNRLRLFAARSSQDFDMGIFNEGDYINAVQQKISSETISKVLYPSDAVEAGRELRLLQEYFLVACAVRDIVRGFLAKSNDFSVFADRVAIQLNDTHPALAVAELMRVLVDENNLEWGPAWETTQATLGYTNHTLLPEALEKWPVALFEYVLPRHLQIIYEINRRFMAQVRQQWPDAPERQARLSIIEEGEQKQVRMAHLAIVGSHAVNGVSALHTDLIKTELVPDFHQLWPEKFTNKTNGVSQRRWLLQANPALADLVTLRIGSGWLKDLDQLRALENHLDDSTFMQEFAAVKRVNKQNLAALIRDSLDLKIDPASLFDVHIKRIHEYKRQMLCLMHAVHEYLRLVEDGIEPTAPRLYLFAGKAAPGYWTALQIIKLINNVASVINKDPRAQGRLSVAFLPDYRVSLAERIIPAADLSEQISLAGKEASGTGNMKFALNGALTMGTLDGANIEIRDEVGEENIFIFGLRRDQVKDLRQQGDYRPRQLYDNDPRLRRVVDALTSGRFVGKGEEELFSWLRTDLLDHGDEYFLLADLRSYIEAQERAGQLFGQPEQWQKKALLNVARIGHFSSDRAIREYAEDIWDLKPA
jgi:glycogen phosphorylase